VRELEVLESGDVSLLASRRDAGAPGTAGGGAGAPGRDRLERGGVWADWDGDTARLAPGDAVRVETPGGGGWGAPRQSASDLASTSARPRRAG
jgi:N-methylhydantoinase B/oxoprolinase/acetone carboxylase alpha subunit